MSVTARRLGGLLTLAALLAVAGCGSQAAGPGEPVDQAAPASSAPAQPADQGGDSSTPTVASGSPSITPGAVTAGAPCDTAGLAASLAGQDGGAGHQHLVIGLKNAGAQPCTVHGFPGVALRSAAGAVVPVRITHDGDMAFPATLPGTVTIAPGKLASFDIGYSDVPRAGETSCRAATTVLVGLPGRTPTLPVTASVAPCDQGHLAVSPLVAGSAGSAG
jgi:hypothetical protein